MTYDLERYLTVRRAYGGSIGPDGRLAFLLDTTGVPQVWTVDEPGEWPTQRTFYDEPVSFASFSPTRSELAFGMDEGGNERTQLFRLDAEGGIHPLTDAPDAKHRWGGWNSTGDRFAFASNRRDEAVFDVYTQDREERGEDAELVFEGDGWYSVAGWRPDDGALLLHRAHSSFDHDLSVLELATGERRRLTADTEGVRYSSPEWGPEGEAIYLVTDKGADTLYLARMDAATGELAVVERGGEWNVDGLALDQESGRLAYSRNVDGYTDLHLAELAGPTELSEFAMPDLPGDVAGGASFGPDGDRVALSASGRTENTNVSVIDVAALPTIEGGAGDPDTAAPAGALTRWTCADAAGIPTETFAEPDLIRYETFDGREIPAYFTLPEDAENAPVIVDIHGGPESQRRPGFSGLRQYFLSRGYALFEPNVRGSAGYGREYTHLDDVENRMDSVR
ncbi:S9 family peptidase, partial [Halobacteriales archaeon QH_10_67_13]